MSSQVEVFWLNPFPIRNKPQSILKTVTNHIWEVVKIKAANSQLALFSFKSGGGREDLQSTVDPPGGGDAELFVQNHWLLVVM